jgi:hypothetical protein
VDDPLGDALVIEPGQLLAKVKVLDQRRSAIPSRQRVIGVLHPHALIGRQLPALVADAIAAQVFKFGSPLLMLFLLPGRR